MFSYACAWLQVFSPEYSNVRATKKQKENPMLSREKTVLVVDDSRTLLMCASVLLQRMGYGVIVAQTGDDCFQLAKLRSPDAIMMDVIMPGQDGIETLELLKGSDETRHIPVVMISSSNSADTIERCKSLGCNNYLRKPLRLTEVHNALENCLALKGAPTRKHMRISFEKQVRTTYGEKKKAYHAVNLSEGGIFIRCMDPLPVGAEVNLLIPLSADLSINTAGEVIYTKDILYGGIFVMMPGMAIRFKDMKDTDRAILSATIQNLLADDLLEEQEIPVIAKD